MAHGGHEHLMPLQPQHLHQQQQQHGQHHSDYAAADDELTDTPSRKHGGKRKRFDAPITAMDEATGALIMLADGEADEHSTATNGGGPSASACSDERSERNGSANYATGDEQAGKNGAETTNGAAAEKGSAGAMSGSDDESNGMCAIYPR